MNVWKIIISYFKNHKLMLLLLIVFIILTSLITLIPPQILKIIVDDNLAVLANNNLFELAILYLLAYILIGVINFFKEVFLIGMSQGINYDLKIKMMEHLHKLPYHVFTSYDAGEIEAYFNNDVEAINTLISSGIVSMVIDCFKIIGIIISIMLFNLYFGIITFGIAIFLFWLILFVKKLMYKAQIKNRTIEGNVNNDMLVYLDNIKTIKSFRIFSFIKEGYQRLLNNHYKTLNSVNFYDSIFSPLMQIIKTIFIVGIILLSSNGNTLFGLTVGALVSSIDLLTNLFAPVENLGMELNTIQKSLASITRINSFLALKEDEYEEENVREVKQILVNDVSFAYTENMVIDHFSYHFDKGSYTIVGPSGTGKSTLFKLIYGALIPNRGSISIDDVNTYQIKNRYGLFGILYQDVFFSCGTIREELTLNKKFSDQEIYQALTIVGLEKRIDDLDKRFYRNDFSLGEQTLLNLARIILINPKIIMLDEINARIDPLTMQIIKDVILQISKNKIVLSISHYGDIILGSKVVDLDKRGL